MWLSPCCKVPESYSLYMNMHVSSASSGVPGAEWLGDWGRSGPSGVGAVARTLQGVLAEVSDEQVESQLPGNRAWVLDQLRLVLEVASEVPDDPRMLKIRLDALDRIARILRVALPQAARLREGDLDRVRLVAAAVAALEELEAKASG